MIAFRESSLPATTLELEAAHPVIKSLAQRLRESSHRYLRSVSCEYVGGVLTLRGRLPSFYLKQMVQVLAEKVEGVDEIINLIDVVHAGRMT